jgi:hypothetical protein
LLFGLDTLGGRRVPRLVLKPVIARMIASELFSSLASLMKDESILILSNGKLRR